MISKVFIPLSLLAVANAGFLHEGFQPIGIQHGPVEPLHAFPADAFGFQRFQPLSGHSIALQEQQIAVPHQVALPQHLAVQQHVALPHQVALPAPLAVQQPVAVQHIQHVEAAPVASESIVGVQKTILKTVQVPYPVDKFVKVDRHIQVPVTKYIRVDRPYEVIKYIQKPVIVKVEKPVHIVKKIAVPQPIVEVEPILPNPQTIVKETVQHPQPQYLPPPQPHNEYLPPTH